MDETITVGPVAPVPHRQSTVDMEAAVKGSNLDWVILRGGAFYGAGTGAEDGWRQLARGRQLQMPGDGSGLISLCHVADVSRAFVAALEKGDCGSIFNVVDDEPVTYRDLLSFVAAQMEAPEPAPNVALSMLSLGCSNGKLKAGLGWAPVYPSFRTGLAM